MRTHGKKYTAAKTQVENKPYPLADALPLVQKIKFAKFDETVALSIRLGVDPKHADQMVRGTVVLPHGLGKSKKVLVIAGPDKQKEAEAAGADHVGGEELVDNATALIDSIVRAKPAAAKGKYLKSITVSSTMGPGVKIDETHVESASAKK